MTRPIALAALSAFLVMLGFGVLFPVLPQFTQELGLSKFQYGLLLSAYPAVGVLVSPLWGRFSDRRGRRPAIVTGLAGFGVSFILFGFGQNFGQLLAARLLGGVLAAAALPTVFAYAADVSTSENRSTAMGIVGAALGLGVALGPALGGGLSLVGLRAPYFAAGFIGLVGAVLVYTTLPESLTDAVRTRAREHRAWLRDRGVTRGRIARTLTPFLGASFLLTLARLSVDVTVAFLVAERLGTGPFGVGLLLFGMGILAFLVQGGAIRPLTRRFGDRRVFLAGTALMGVGLFAVGAVQSWPLLIAAGGAIAAGFALHTPTLTALLSCAAEGVQGEAQGLNASAQSLSRVIGPVAFATLYDYSQAVPYALAAGLCALAIVTTWRSVDDGRRVVGPEAYPDDAESSG